MAVLGFFLHFFDISISENSNMMVTHQRIAFASFVGFKTPRNIVERCSSKHR